MLAEKTDLVLYFGPETGMRCLEKIYEVKKSGNRRHWCSEQKFVGKNR